MLNCHRFSISSAFAQLKKYRPGGWQWQSADSNEFELESVMARMARVVVPGYPHHVTQRGNRKQRTFFEPSDYRAYQGMVSRAKVEAGVEIWGYCLMPNLVHLVMVPERDDSLAMLFRDAHRRYTRRINTREGWCGHLWQERFHSFPMLERTGDWLSYLSDFDDTCHQLDTLRKHSRTGRPAGDETFVSMLEDLTGRRLRKLKAGPRRNFK